MPHEASFADRHLEMAEELRDWLAEALPQPTKVKRAYSPDESANLPLGRLVWVYPTSEDDAVVLGRGKKYLTDYGFVIEYARKYEPPMQPTGQEPIPEDWVDEECGWVRANIYAPLNDRVKKRERIFTDAVPQTCRLAVKFDPGRLQAGEFRSLVEVTFREEREA